MYRGFSYIVYIMYTLFLFQVFVFALHLLSFEDFDILIIKLYIGIT